MTKIVRTGQKETQVASITDEERQKQYDNNRKRSPGLDSSIDLMTYFNSSSILYMNAGEIERKNSDT